MRVFIALEPPEDAVNTLVQWQHANKPEGVYLEPPTNLHLTLSFLGDVDDSLIPHIQDILAHIDPSTILLSGPVEYREQDRLAFLVYQEQGGQEAWEELNAELKSLYGYEPQFHPWLAHTTVWRFAPDHKPNVNPPLPSVSFTPVSVSLYTSVKNPAGGATYQKVGAVQQYVPLPNPKFDDYFIPVEYDPEYFREAGLAQGGPFGYIGGRFLAGGGHHQQIIGELMKHGWTWEDLFTAPQAWGWMGTAYESEKTADPYGNYKAHSDRPYLKLSFGSDSGFQTDVDGCCQYVANKYKIPVRNAYAGEESGVESQDDYGTGLSGKDQLNYYVKNDRKLKLNGGDSIPPAPSQDRGVPEHPEWAPPGLHMMPTKFPPPKQTFSASPDPDGNLPRVVWALDRHGKLHMSTAHPDADHWGLPIDSYEDVGAAGDFYILDNDTAQGRLLAWDLTDDTKLDILSYVTAEFRRSHPYTELEDIDDLTVKQAGMKVAETEQVIDGYQVVEMESGEYPNHDAIWIGRGPQGNILVINYNGHHDPIFEAHPEFYELAGHDTAAGHWRLEPSRTEPFGTGWGWHHGQANQEEMNIIMHVLKAHYGVTDLEKSFLENQEKEPEQLKLFSKKFPPFILKKISWLDTPKETGLDRPKNWWAEYDPVKDFLLISDDPQVKFRGNTVLSGFYTKIEKANGPHVGRARDLMEEALQERYRTAEGA